ncbi:MAG TPA: methylenetetrahydrofolate reductase, partial [Candidatus Manganitrophaceae bacterium]|nr:methylenetetrahydrofolate reductase [Candidatus Manganitrophaceae bacterium]
MKTLKEACETGEFILTAELLPPKGSDISPFQERAKRLLGKVHAVNVTDNPGAVMRAGALAMSKLLLDLGHDPIYQMTARDRNRLAIQSDLLGAHILGVRNVLCLRGDDVTVGDQKESRPVFDLDSVQMLRVIAGLNQGRDMAGNRLNGATSFFPGGAVAPEGAPLDLVLANFGEKAAAGAKFFQTQGIFHPELFERFMERARKWDVKIIAGVILLRSAKRARYMAENIPGVR